MKILRKLVIIPVIISIIASMLTVFAAATPVLAFGAATVDVPVLNLRAGPSQSHTILTRLTEGDIIVVLERTNNDWFMINFHGTVGYVSAQFLREILTAENFSALGTITGSRVNVRARPNLTSNVLGAYNERTVMTVIGINNGWYKVTHDGITGYVRSDFMDIISGYRPSSPTRIEAAVGSGSYHANAALGREIAEYALGYLGSRYVYGGASPAGFDCSGFVAYVLRNFGISVTRNASGQYRDNGYLIDKADLYPGDLVFFSSNGHRSVTHVGIYIGDNEFVHSSTSTTGVIISRLDSANYTRTWFGAKRVI